MSKPIFIKPDKRFKKGNVKRTGRELRGNPETLEMKRLEAFAFADQINPPIVISREMAKELEKLL